MFTSLLTARRKPAHTARRLRLVLALAATVVLAPACSKDEPKDYTQIDAGLLTQYVADNHLTAAKKQPSGLVFVPISTDSSAVRATAGRTVKVLYSGQLLNGTVFDASAQHGNTPFSFVLGQGQVIAGWDVGIALMHKGDRATLLIPSGLGYGSDGYGSSIPPNSPLRFDVQLVDVR